MMLPLLNGPINRFGIRARRRFYSDRSIAAIRGFYKKRTQEAIDEANELRPKTINAINELASVKQECQEWTGFLENEIMRLNALLPSKKRKTMLQILESYRNQRAK